MTSQPWTPRDVLGHGAPGLKGATSTQRFLTFVVPFDLGVGGHNGANHTGLSLVGLVVGFGVVRWGRHGCGLGRVSVREICQQLGRGENRTDDGVQDGEGNKDQRSESPHRCKLNETHQARRRRRDPCEEIGDEVDDDVDVKLTTEIAMWEFKGL